MKKKAPSPKPTKWNKRSIAVSVGIFLVLFIIIFSINVGWGDIKESLFKDRYLHTIGEITKYDVIDMPYSNRLGSSIISNYKIEYAYYVSGVRYVKGELIDINPNTIKKIIVSYRKDNPKHSTIEIE